MIVEPSEMISLLHDFLNQSQTNFAVVGGIAGTEINKFVIDAVTETIPFEKVLVIQSCQDYIGIMEKPLPNVKFFGDILISEYIDPPEFMRNAWRSRVEQGLPDIVNKIDSTLLNGYDAVVMYDAHLIEPWLARGIKEVFAGPVIYVIDPIEGQDFVWGMDRAEIPCVVDTLLKLPPNIAMARDIVGFDTRSINTRANCSVREIKSMSTRSIGKMDDKQYVTNDHDLITIIREKQYKSPFRKNQKVIVMEDKDVMLDGSNVTRKVIHNSMLVVDNANSRPLMKFRLYNSKTLYATDVIYDKHYNRFLSHFTDIRVKPANILSTYEAMHHRFNHIIYIEENCDKDDDNPLGLDTGFSHSYKTRTMYSLLKNSKHLTIVKKWK